MPRRSRSRAPGRAAAALVVASLMGCAHQAGPAEAAATFGAALERGDVAGAYALLSADTRARLPLAVFKLQLDEGGASTRQAARALRDGKLSAPPRAALELPDGDTLTLIQENGAWRVDGHPLEAWGQRSPRAALRTFVRAVESRRYDVVLRLVPMRHRATVTVETLRLFWEGGAAAENARVVGRLKAALSAPIVELGDEARMPYAERAEARLVREDGLWKIETPD
ncbi:MAG: hypothetical protein JWM82_3634 [Myxococcales bacterium]|nr:hypothetical protein [Myxococcales bacterium]